ncbi:hypothetical protein [Novosphingobium sp.]|uniref:hypothetical protein n=1 Tax=Novosphingobium sp. TaxID=1874826 RepID=UPI003D0EF04E
MLGEQAQHLLRDVFGGPLNGTLDQAHRITRRVVLWGGDEPHTVPHAALVISGSRLESALHERPSPEGEGPSSRQSEPSFVLSTTAPATGTVLRFGQREASATPVVLQPGADPHAALIEAVEQGWLFVIPTCGQNGWLLTVGASPADALRESRLVASAVAETGETSKQFETAPRILGHPATPGGLTLGTAALAFDPICGDGVATAVRGGILAAAIAAELATETALDRAAMIGHYRAMLIAAMRRHLAVSAPFYERGGQGPWWREQAEATARGHAWCTRQLAAAGEAQFVLIGDRIALRDRVA